MKSGASHEWLKHAEADLRYAKLGRCEAASLSNLIAFHAQQAVEKALKAVLVERQVEFPRTHDIEELIFIIQETGLTWSSELDEAKNLAPFAVQSRYPGFDDPITEAEMDDAISIAQDILLWATEAIKQSSADNPPPSS